MTTERRRAGAWIAGAAATGIILRLPGLWHPLSVDEAGALTVARSWAAGQRLYVDTFIDRPQGVVVVFQQWDARFGGSAASVRSLALLAGVAVLLGAAATARAVAHRWSAAAVAAWLVAVITASPAIEGGTANGELLAAAVTVPAMAIAASVAVRRIPGPWLVAAGALAAAGITVKQSGYDVLVAIAIWLVIAAWQRWRTPRAAAALAGWFALGAAAVLVPVAWHGAHLGWDAYEYAVYGFRLRVRSAVAGPQGARMALTVLIAMPLIGPAVALALRRVRQLRQRRGPICPRLRPEHVLVLMWAAVATAGFLTGGNYHRHYWIQLAVPVATLAAVALTAGPGVTERGLVRTTAAALVVPLLISIALLVHPSWERDPRVDADIAIARWYREHRPSPAADLLPLCASVTWYPEAGRLPTTRYLWVDHVRAGRGATGALVARVEGPDRPTYLAMHQPADRCDPTGRLRRAIEQQYRRVATVDGVDILQAVHES